ncbi:RNA-guided endonuclease IscB [Janthinobacterium sp. NKUCC06_STL]|uniref:RNA-guided endonuclease IscB n=1 Tax=Janthinobacterium sp. NKUCC06_STL TaxID=2842127 RepID=UPI001C5AE08E|nr:RNA-guided endonuclease IscB [Janthinobacterium sp. NKUCC06_STL]MBW3512022.1 HNH endonuclease [Janthinobacterium sp. NKUCC06_STL]
MPVFVLDRNKRPLMPCSPKRARALLTAGRTRVHGLFPFCIRLVDCLLETSVLQPLRLSLAPGSKTTGLALCTIEDTVDADGVAEQVMHIRFLLALAHRGAAIRDALHSRAALRGGRRGNLRYRALRFNNGSKPKGWLPPSLRLPLDSPPAWVARLRRLAPVTHLAQELVSFDTQLLQNPDISGVWYQQETLVGYEVREYLLEKFHRTCAYCDATDVLLQIEHMHVSATGSSNRVSNLTLVCGPCNRQKAAQDIQVFLANASARLARLLQFATMPLRDAAADNATRWVLLSALEKTGLPVQTGTGGRTKWNRSRLGLVKTHALDAACVGMGVVRDMRGTHVSTLRATCTGRGSRCKTRLGRFGFPRAYLTLKKTALGFRTGHMVMSTVPSGRRRGVHKGRVSIRMTNNFNIHSGLAGAGTMQGFAHRCCRLLQRADGYDYAWQPTLFPQPVTEAATAQRSAPVLPALKDRVFRSNI